ncbi:glycosyltransferase family 4 protein [Sphingobacterium bovistauri]|uniref:Glycosyltransferase family 4 protein n=1 Tax=Sphingobacterium bovistauri TaxID=2781959 RepID=A0ABS7Z5V2_9SPHI|nr:glycosyltransferase family 4 protein [Sphingobacterium bovistauri]MCA5004124.1 glycosyltransferase family 4 protein [Sphingobacterium bovistauri]
MRILYTILGTFNSGGMERVLANKANYLARLGYEVIIITTDQKNRKPYFDMDESIQHIDLGINYTDDISKNIFSRTVSYLRKRYLHKARIGAVLNQFRPSITISMFDNDVAFITDIKDGSKKIVEIHFSRFKRLQYNRSGIWKVINSYRSKMDSNIVKKFDRFVVLTEEDKGYWGKLSNIQVIPNANSFESNEQSILENKQVMAVGRFDYQKGFDELIEIWAKVAETFPEWKLNIYGQGPLRDQYQALINLLGLSDKVFLNQPQKDIKLIYLEHSVLAMTSRYEGLPMVLLEGQVCGLPMVSYACKCGPSDIIRDGVNGYLVEEEDKNAFAQKLIAVMQDKSLRQSMGRSSYNNSKNFEVEKIMQKWITLFDEIIKE